MDYHLTITIRNGAIMPRINKLIAATVAAQAARLKEDYTFGKKEELSTIRSVISDRLKGASDQHKLDLATIEADAGFFGDTDALTAAKAREAARTKKLRSSGRL